MVKDNRKASKNECTAMPFEPPPPSLPRYRWQAEKLGDKAAFLVKGVGEGGKAAIAAGRVGGGNSKGLTKSYFRTNLAKVLRATSRTGDVEGSLEVLKYMSAMGVSLVGVPCVNILGGAVGKVFGGCHG